MLAAAALTLATSSALQAAPSEGAADDPVGFVILRDNGTGSAAQAEGPLTRLLAHVASLNGWASALGQYFTERAKGVAYIDSTKPEFGMFALGDYLALRKAHGLRPIGASSLNATGTAQFFVISKTEKTLAGCKGKTLATNQAGDRKYIDAVVSGDAFDLSDFIVVETRRPVQTLKKVLRDEAVCALVDDAQIAAMYAIEDGHTMHPVWSSKEFPGLVVASFGSAPAEHVKSFAKHLTQLCEGAGKEACGAAGLHPPTAVKPDAYAELQRAYDK